MALLPGGIHGAVDLGLGPLVSFLSSADTHRGDQQREAGSWRVCLSTESSQDATAAVQGQQASAIGQSPGRFLFTRLLSLRPFSILQPSAAV